MNTTIDSFHIFLIEKINSYNNFLIYGYGELGKALYRHCSYITKNIKVIDKNVKDDLINIDTIENINNLDNNVLIINTVLNQIESLNIHVNLKSKFPNNEIIDCRMFKIQNSNTNLFLSIETQGYLYDIGWIESYKEKKSCDRYGNPLPWVTYPFIDFIEPRLNNQMDIFEFGAGHSSIWYSNKVNNVYSVEHDKNWFEIIRNSNINNLNVYYQNLEYDGKYCRYIETINKKFDLIIVDGRDRVNCIKQSVKYLKPNGVIILDDSEREQYKEGVLNLLNSNFKKIDFWGIAPGIFFKKCTSIFYKTNNCLGI